LTGGWKKLIRKTLSSIIISLILIILFSFSVYAQPNVPMKPTTNIYVQDYARMISQPTVAQISEEAGKLDLKTTAQVCIVTINNLVGNSIEEYANTLFRKWGIGSKGKDNGVLLLISKEDREMRIEVGYGLEGRINDAKAGRMIQVLSGYLKQGKNDEGIYYTFSSIAKEIYDEYGITDKSNKYQGKVNSTNRANNTKTSTNIDYRWVIAVVVVFLLLMSNRPGRRFLGILFQILLSIGLRGRGGGGFGGGGSGGGGSFGGGSSGGGGASGKW
jgi:uncharacterized protein